MAHRTGPVIEMDVALGAAEIHLILALAAGVAWLLTAGRILRGSLLGDLGEIAVGVCIAAALVVLIFGSLFLLGIIDTTAWFVTGAALRVIVMIAGIVAFIDQRRIPLIDEYAQFAAALQAERTASFAHLAGAIAENTRLTQRASDEANRANDAATAVRAELADQADTIIAQGVLAADAQGTIKTTAVEVHDIHDATVPSGKAVVNAQSPEEVDDVDPEAK